jgi:hypothetical protein
VLIFPEKTTRVGFARLSLGTLFMFSFIGNPYGCLAALSRIYRSKKNYHIYIWKIMSSFYIKLFFRELSHIFGK